MVIGLNLCPFAARVFEANAIRFTATDATDPADLLSELARELQTLASSPTTIAETTIFIHPYALSDFLDYNDFLGVAEEMVDDLGLRGMIQIVGFHPQYQFAGTDPDAAENYTNRSPYPMLHLLREASITALAAKPEELLEIPNRNIKTLKALGTAKILAKLKADRAMAADE